jgi:hypothetical protein
MARLPALVRRAALRPEVTFVRRCRSDLLALPARGALGCGTDPRARRSRPRSSGEVTPFGTSETRRPSRSSISWWRVTRPVVAACLRRRNAPGRPPRTLCGLPPRPLLQWCRTSPRPADPPYVGPVVSRILPDVLRPCHCRIPIQSLVRPLCAHDSPESHAGGAAGDRLHQACVNAGGCGKGRAGHAAMAGPVESAER